MDSEGLMSLWLLIWQELNGFDNTNNEYALRKQSKTNGCVGLQQINDNNSKASNEKHQMNLQKGAGGQKFH